MSQPVDPFLALIAYTCGYQGSSMYLDPFAVINTCLESGAKHCALLALNYLLGGMRGDAPAVSIVPQRYIHRIESICLIPPAQWRLHGLPVEDFLNINQMFTHTEQTEKSMVVEYTAYVKEVYGVVVTYRDEDGRPVHVGVAIHHVGTVGNYLALLTPPSVTEKMLEICRKRGRSHYTPSENTLPPEMIKKIAVESGTWTERGTTGIEQPEKNYEVYEEEVYEEREQL